VRTFILEHEQWLRKPVDEVFAFFSDARNLETITPAWLGFRILSPGPIPMRVGTHITYRLHWHRLPLRWVTEIVQWEPPVRFVDVQRRGPYALWYHTHEFEPHDGGTRMWDRVEYALPLGFLGTLVHRFVRRDLEAVFDYRATQVERIFASQPTRTAAALPVPAHPQA
jgi:ligand-binding SRPBCC domain-containing protein